MFIFLRSRTHYLETSQLCSVFNINSAGLFGAVTIELNDLIKTLVAIDRKNKNWILSTVIGMLILLYLGSLISIKMRDKEKQDKPLLMLNAGFIVVFIALYILCEKMVDWYRYIRPGFTLRINWLVSKLTR